MDARSARDLWKLDPERSSLTFTLRHALLGEIRGQLRCWGGRVLLESEDPMELSVHVWADLSSLDTGSKRRNDTLLETELFDSQWQSALVFDSERVEAAGGDKAVVEGWLGLGSYWKRISVSVESASALAVDSGPPHIVATAHATIDRHQFGLLRKRRGRDWLSERLVDRQVDVAAHLELIPVASAVAPDSFLRPPGARAPVRISNSLESARLGPATMQGI
jgi:polyisoprenoid-binding protein YceI